jgi:Galactose mutarotase and related enzymes
MTNHSYFNLDGDASSNAEHLLTINADNYTPVDSTFMTTGEIVPVEGTPMDFRTPTAVGKRINDYSFVQLKNGNGYDHNWVLNTKGDITKKCATLESPKTGIVLDVYTNEPGIQMYAGNFLDGKVKGKKGITYRQRASVCLETQKYPDTPNKPQWPSAVLRPGEKYNSHCIFKFSVKK